MCNRSNYTSYYLRNFLHHLYVLVGLKCKRQKSIKALSTRKTHKSGHQSINLTARLMYFVLYNAHCTHHAITNDQKTQMGTVKQEKDLVFLNYQVY